MYYAHAKKSAEGGDLQEARESALQAIQHVSMESARLHLLLGNIAISLKDKDLLRDARRFLEFLRVGQALRELNALEQSGNSW